MGNIWGKKLSSTDLQFSPFLNIYGVLIVCFDFFFFIWWLATKSQIFWIIHFLPWNKRWTDKNFLRLFKSGSLRENLLWRSFLWLSSSTSSARINEIMMATCTWKKSKFCLVTPLSKKVRCVIMKVLKLLFRKGLSIYNILAFKSWIYAPKILSRMGMNFCWILSQSNLDTKNTN